MAKSQNPVDELRSLLISSRESVVDESDGDATERAKSQLRMFVSTPLEQELESMISGDDQPDLIVLTGNAGDGKSALIRRLLPNLDPSVANDPHFVIWDATHSLSASGSQHEALALFFEPFLDSPKRKWQQTQIIAINTGLLVRFFLCYFFYAATGIMA